MKINCMAIDDEPLALNKLKRNILKFPYMELVASCHNAAQAGRILETTPVDLIYIDINMPDINGLDFVRNLDNPPMVVFVTAYPDFAVESYKVNAIDYLLKPYGSEDFKRTAEKAYRHWQLLTANQEPANSSRDNGVVYLKCEYRYLRVDLDDILFIEGQSEYLKINLKSSASFLTHMTFRQIIEMLPDHFFQIHRSYLVNMNHVISVERSFVVLEDETRLPVSESRKSYLLQYLRKGQC